VGPRLHVLARAVLDGEVPTSEHFAEPRVESRFIGHQPRAKVNIRFDCAAERSGSDTLKREETHVTAALCERDHGGLLLALALHARLATDVRLVDFDRLTLAADHRRVGRSFHRITDAAQNEQRAPVRDLHFARELKRTDSLLARACAPECVYPNAQR